VCEVGGEDYVFIPKYPGSRGRALNLLQRQFVVLSAASRVPREVLGETRSLYSLGQSSIRYRLLYGDAINILALARNAKTSVEMID